MVWFLLALVTGYVQKGWCRERGKGEGTGKKNSEGEEVKGRG